MARFPKGVSSDAASAHAAMMRALKGGKGGCFGMAFMFAIIGGSVSYELFA